MKIDDLNYFAETRGDLIPIEFDSLPFIPKRVFVVKGCPKGVIRGNHAHYTTKQYLICIQGEIKVFIYDGKDSKELILKEGQTTLIDVLQWDSQEFRTGNDVLLVMCSTPYSLEDYIFSIREFLKALKENQ